MRPIHRLFSTLPLAAMLLGGVISSAEGQTVVQRPKAYLKSDAVALGLVWNADKGEWGRGRGEIYVTVWMYWPSDVECPNPQQKTFGPLGGDGEFPSGTVVQNNPPNGPWQVVPAVVPVVGNIYFCEANCPVADYVLVEVFVWESDCNKTLNDYVKVMKDAIDDAAGDASQQQSLFGWVQVITAGIAALIDILTQSSDDEVGRFSGTVSFPNPCPSSFVVIRELPLENLCKALWKDQKAVAEGGQVFSDPPYNIQPPDQIGALVLMFLGGPLIGKHCVHTVYPEASTAYSIGSFDFGQPDEVTVTARIDVGAAISFEPTGVSYAVAIDADNDPTTGSSLLWAQGAEFLLRSQITDGGGAAAQLDVWSETDLAFGPTPIPVHEVEVDPTRMAVLITAELATMGILEGDIAVRSLVLDGNLPLHVLPAPDEPGLVLTINPEPTGAPPAVIDASIRHEARDVPIDHQLRLRFSKTMDQISVMESFQIEPFVPLTMTWQGDVMLVHFDKPLQYGTDYTVTISPSATDRVGTPLDGNGDGEVEPADFFTLPFRTAHRPMPTFAQDGVQSGAFMPGEGILVQIDDVAPGQSGLVHLVLHDPLALFAGEPLKDVSSDGPNPLIANDGVLLSVGSIAEEGEYNVVYDIDGDGYYTPGTDRIDRSGIGFAVLPDCDGSGAIDALEIAAGILVDSDGDGTPDVCEKSPCTGDFNGDGIVNGADLGVLLGGWGSCRDGCAADLNNDGTVDGADLGVLLGAWGTCP